MHVTGRDFFKTRRRIEHVPPGEHVVDEHSESERVGVATCRRSRRNLGSEQFPRSHDLGGGRQSFGGAHEAEISDLPGEPSKEDVAGVEIAVDPTGVVVQVLEAFDDLRHRPAKERVPIVGPRRHVEERGITQLDAEGHVLAPVELDLSRLGSHGDDVVVGDLPELIDLLSHGFPVGFS